MLTVDLADFFPATAAWRVRRWFGQQGWQGESLEALVRLCVYRGGLPQGAPTSPALSNLVNGRLDTELAELAAIHSARYSRYCDDLAFSWSTPAEPLSFRRQVEDRLARFGYRIQPSKTWHLQSARERPEITGLALVGRRLRLPERILNRIRLLKRRRNDGDEHVRAQLRGYRALRKMLK